MINQTNHDNEIENTHDEISERRKSTISSGSSSPATKDAMQQKVNDVLQVVSPQEKMNCSELRKPDF